MARLSILTQEEIDSLYSIPHLDDDERSFFYLESMNFTIEENINIQEVIDKFLANSKINFFVCKPMAVGLQRRLVTNRSFSLRASLRKYFSSY